MGPRASTLPSNVSVGMLDILIPAGSDPYVRYGSFFSRTERDVGEVLTLRYRSNSGGALSKLPYDFPSLAFPGDDSRSEDLAPSEGNMYLRWETPRAH